MGSTILISILVLGGLGIVGSVVLWGVARRFHVEEDPRIGEIEKVLPGANCGGCGHSGCHDFAATCAGAQSLDRLNCPVGGDGVMRRIAAITGHAAAASEPRVAVVKCGGECGKRTRSAAYSGPASCAVAATLGAADGGCPFGCLGCGDCAHACKWGAITIDGTTGIPVVDQERCTGCGACAATCPRSLIELRAIGPRGMRVWVACSNHERGPVAVKECKAACIACGKCVRVCTHDAITVSGNVAYIDGSKCRLCGKCVAECPTGAIRPANFPVKKPVKAATA